MKSQNSLSDIEQILRTQTWKHKKLPSLPSQRKPLKVRSVVDKETPRKSLRIITQPASTLQEPLIDEIPEQHPVVCRNREGQRSLCSLVIPALVSTDDNSAVSSRRESFDFQIPVFPKAQFANSSKNLAIVPRFENLPCAYSNDFITERKIEVGRIKKYGSKTQRKKFEYLENFNNIKDEKALKRRDTIYLNN